MSITLKELFAKDDWQQLIETELKALAAEKPDFQYTTEMFKGCYYHKGSQFGPTCDGCIFGQAFQRLGVAKAELEFNGITHVIPDIAKDYERIAPNNWYYVQRAQDEGQTWGAAITHL